MSRITETHVSIQTSPQLVPSLPSWFGEVVLVVTYLKKQGVLTKLYEQVRFARKRFAVPFMALFERDRLPSRSALSRFLAALTEEPIEALRMLFLDDLLARPLTPNKQTGGLVDRAGKTWIVFDIDGTREAARQFREPWEWTISGGTAHT